MDLKLDWLSFTFKPDINAMVRNRYQQLWNDAFVDIEEDACSCDLKKFFIAFPEIAKVSDELLILGGRTHYQHVVGIGDYIRISYNDEDYSIVDMGVNVSVPSHGLEWFFNLFDIDREKEGAVSLLFQLLHERGCSCTRIDLAFDDYSKTFRPRWYSQRFIANQLRTNFRKIRTASCMHEIGWTLYLGDRKKRMLRIYDKDVESHGAIDAVRYEFELHQHHAKDMFQYLIDNKTIDFRAYLQTFFVVVDLDSAKYKGNCKLLPEWEKWFIELDFCEELPKKVEIPHYSLAQRMDKVRWFFQANLPQVKDYISIFGVESLLAACANIKNREMSEKWQSVAYKVDHLCLEERYSYISLDSGIEKPEYHFYESILPFDSVQFESFDTFNKIF